MRLSSGHARLPSEPGAASGVGGLAPGRLGRRGWLGAPRPMAPQHPRRRSPLKPAKKSALRPTQRSRRRSRRRKRNRRKRSRRKGRRSGGIEETVMRRWPSRRRLSMLARSRRLQLCHPRRRLSAVASGNGTARRMVRMHCRGGRRRSSPWHEEEVTDVARALAVALSPRNVGVSHDWWSTAAPRSRRRAPLCSQLLTYTTTASSMID